MKLLVGALGLVLIYLAASGKLRAVIDATKGGGGGGGGGGAARPAAGSVAKPRDGGQNPLPDRK